MGRLIRNVCVVRFKESYRELCAYKTIHQPGLRYQRTRPTPVLPPMSEKYAVTNVIILSHTRKKPKKLFQVFRMLFPIRRIRSKRM